MVLPPRGMEGIHFRKSGRKSSASNGKHIFSQILDGKVKYSEYFEGDVSETLLDFSEGKLQCLIACHRLSEGIDIKGLKNIVFDNQIKCNTPKIEIT